MPGARLSPTPHRATCLGPSEREVRRAGCPGVRGTSPVFPQDKAEDPRASFNPCTATRRPSAACPTSPSRVGDPSHMESVSSQLPASLAAASAREFWNRRNKETFS